MSNIFKGRSWEKVAEERARQLSKIYSGTESLWELYLGKVNENMLKELEGDRK